MATNYPGPFEVRINYTTAEPVAINKHQLRLSFQCAATGSPGDPFANWAPIARNGTSAVSLANHVNSLIAAIDDQYVAATSFVDAELWEYTPGTFDAIYRSAMAINSPGTGVGSVQSMAQTIWTFRTSLGGVMKVDLRGSNHAPGLRSTLPGTGNVAVLSNYIVNAAQPWWGRDNSYPIAPLYFLPGQNEHAFQTLNR